ncbi:hypothetical protein GQA12_08110 [Paenibacillus alvei]|nr:hypothetical protein [Paenibacillus alvei]
MADRAYLVNQQACSKISITIVCDGQGVAHPRRFGLASHLGVLFNIPAIGCGKTKLIGDSEEPSQKSGEYATLFDQSDKIDVVLRTQDHINPIYVSVGHRISLPTVCQPALVDRQNLLYDAYLYTPCPAATFYNRHGYT